MDPSKGKIRVQNGQGVPIARNHVVDTIGPETSRNEVSSRMGTLVPMTDSKPSKAASSLSNAGVTRTIWGASDGCLPTVSMAWSKACLAVLGTEGKSL
ncbi:MAG: hypothetical protein M2R45_02792 [Verrucomicrobia subdivision 3 bacterium]|nr:hypothetical protein [Limisphaerales bacterium]MCS1414344.1 hypothetical protein [Limisphaerales bacterium]